MTLALLTAAVLAVALPKPAQVSHVPLTTSGVGDTTLGTGVTPTLDCRNYVSGNWACTGATFTAYGTPTSGNSPLHPSGFSGSPMTWAVLDYTSSQRFNGGDILDYTTDLTICVVFTHTVDNPDAEMILTKSQAGQRAFELSANNSAFTFYVFDAAGSSSTATLSKAVGPETHIGCGSYHYITSGTSTIYVNLDGSANSNTTAIGPIKTSDAEVLIAARFAYSGFLTGAISLLTVWDQSFSAARLAQMVNAMRAHIGTAKEPLTVVRASNELFQPTSSSNYFYTAQNTLGVTSSGAYHGPAIGTLLPLYNDAYDNGAWVPEASGAGATVVTAAQADGWDGQSLTADQIAVAAVTDNDYSGNCQAFTATAAKWRVDIAAKTASGTANPYLYLYNGATYYSTQCAFTTAYSWCGLTSSGNLSAATWKVCIGTDSRDAAQTTTAANTILAWRSTLSATQFRPPPYQVAGVAVSVPATQDSMTSNLTGGPQDWCVYVKPTPASGLNWNSAVARYIFSKGTDAAANSAHARFAANGDLYFYVYDAAGASKDVYLTPSADATQAAWSFCQSATGDLSIGKNGVAQATTGEGAGTGIIGTMPAALYLGEKSDGTTQFAGAMRDWIETPWFDHVKGAP